jgi:hypothetical protein
MTVFRDTTLLAAGPQVNAVVRRRRALMRVDGYHRTWEVDDLASLADVLSWRDERGGAMLWLTPDESRFPSLAVRISGVVADVHYFPRDGHPGFRCLGGVGLPAGGMTWLVYQGADPATGEETPNEFVVPVELAGEVAAEFFRSQQMAATVSWFEL